VSASQLAVCANFGLTAQGRSLLRLQRIRQASQWARRSEISVGRYRTAEFTYATTIYLTNTVGIARDAGVIIRADRYQHKGIVVRRMFADTVADIFVMVDGEGPYEFKAARVLIQELINHDLDLVCGIRRPDRSRCLSSRTQAR
jgi:hypothetical protein